MAKNYTITEVAEIIVAGTDAEAILDIGKRFPLLLSKATKLAAKAPEEFKDLMRFMPEYLTANKLNSSIKKVLLDGEAEENVATDEVVEEKKTIKKNTKTKKVAEPEPETEDEEDEENPYAGKTAMELFKECKARGIKVKPKQKAAIYVEVLLKDDAANAGDDEEDWDDEEETPVTTKKKPEKKTSKKAAKKEVEEENDDDDEWDI